MNKKFMNNIIDILLIVVGTTLYAASVNVFYDPNELVLGGVSGLGIMIRSVARVNAGIDIPMWLLNIIFNAPLLIAGYIILGKKFISRTILGVISATFALSYTKLIPVYQGDIALALIYGGVIAGAGLGLVFRAMASTGGSDIIATIIHKFYEHISVSKAIFILDFIVIGIGFMVFGAEKCMYSLISIFISSKCIGAMLEGMSFAKAAFIISDKYEEISETIMQRTGRGVTALSATGMYTKNKKRVLLCVFSQKEIASMKRIIHSIDNNAFLMVTDFKEVLGEGFSPLHKD